MKLQKRFSRKVNNKEYVKWILTIPPEDIEKIGWKEGQDVNSMVVADGLLIKKSESINYVDFKNRLYALLNEGFGFTWNEIKRKLNIEQVVPNNKWVNDLQKDIQLRRRKIGATTYWYLEKGGTPIYTIGYEGKSVEELIEILKRYEIKRLIDVRQLALSRKNGFSKSILKDKLNENHIGYQNIQELGSPRALRHQLWNDKNYDEFFKKYSEWLDSSDSETSLENLEGLAHIRATAIMCFEKDVEKCHRSIIKKRLIQDGFKVVDL